MPRKLLAAVLSSALLWTSVAGAAPQATEPLKPAAPASAQTASPRNQPPLPPGRALPIEQAQGDEYDDLGMGVIIASWVAAVAVIVLVVFNDDDDDESDPPTGTD
jgi:hypothetical protein